MTRRRWIADQWIADQANGDSASLLGDHALHLARVLRAKVGEEFDIALNVDGQARVRRGTITSISDDRVDFSLGHVVDASLNAAPKITLALAIFKFDRMEWALEKCTEIGVASIVPVIAHRTDPHLAAASIKRHERWLRLVRQASEQSRRSAPPEIALPIKLKDLSSILTPDFPTRVVLSESLSESVNEQEGSKLTDVLQSAPAAVALAVGPEGGWTGEELSWFHQTGWVAASLGNTILRAETAAILSTALAMDAMR
jgi:16S rRNA (uracil1498-N3)-methyltransferase